mmetsp:Transcript_6684/g.20711  ORF Transcript_6684/g.20711 Transcript_6684/m.20711 type:complete len:374 (-) Transcript_6684:7-1128(-)
MHLHGCEQPAEVLEALCKGCVHRSPVGVDGIVAVDGLARALLIPAVRHCLEAAGPGEAQEPVLVTGHGEVGVCRRGVAVVADYGQDLLAPPLLPLRPELGQHRCAVDEVAVVEVVVVVDAVPEVHALVAQGRARVRLLGVVGAVRVALAPAVVVVAAAGQQPAPGGVVHEGRLRVRAQPDLHALGQPVHHLRKVGLSSLPQLIRDRHQPRKPRDHLPGEVGVAHAELVVQGQVVVLVRHRAVPERAPRALERLQDVRPQARRHRPGRPQADVREELVPQAPRVAHDGRGRAAEVLEGRVRLQRGPVVREGALPLQAAHLQAERGRQALGHDAEVRQPQGRRLCHARRGEARGHKQAEERGHRARRPARATTRP